MRRYSSVLVVVCGALIACGDPHTQRAEPVADVLFLRSPQGVSVIDTGAAAGEDPTVGADVTSSDWSTAVKTVPSNEMTYVQAVDPSSGAERWRTKLKGALRAKLLSEDGDLAALGPTREPYFGVGRSETTLVIAGSGMVQPRTVVLDGNYEPEAFSTDGEHLFVIKYLPALRPTKYQVRQLDIDTGRVRGVFTPHDELQRPMGGSARIQVASPDGRRLYTLYTVGGDNGYAFIHVLALDDMWAHCIALPREFARRAQLATALTISPDGDWLYVTNALADAVAEIDTDALTVARTGSVELAEGGGTRATHDGADRFYFAAGRDLTSIDTSTLRVIDNWKLESRISGIQAGADAKKVYVAVGREVLVVEPDTGRTLDEIDPEGVGRIDDLGTGMRWVDSGIVKCAC